MTMDCLSPLPSIFYPPNIPLPPNSVFSGTHMLYVRSYRWGYPQYHIFIFPRVALGINRCDESTIVAIAGLSVTHPAFLLTIAAERSQ